MMRSYYILNNIIHNLYMSRCFLWFPSVSPVLIYSIFPIHRHDPHRVFDKRRPVDFIQFSESFRFCGQNFSNKQLLIVIIFLTKISNNYSSSWMFTNCRYVLLDYKNQKIFHNNAKAMKKKLYTRLFKILIRNRKLRILCQT